MSGTRIHAFFLVAMLPLNALANDFDEEARRNGYQRLSPQLNDKGEVATGKGASAYARIVEPRRKLAILDLAARSEQTNSSYSIVNVEIDCQAMSMRYRSAQLLDPPWILKGIERRVRGPWHVPNKHSIQEQALSLACRA